MPQSPAAPRVSQDAAGAWRRRAWLLCAVACAVALSLLAPRPWPLGDGRWVLRHRGSIVLQAPVALVADKAARDRALATAQRVRATLFAPDRTTPRAPLRAEIVLDPALSPDTLPLASLRLSLVLPDGREELIPITRWDPARHAYRALRRPPVHGDVVLGLLGAVVVLWVSEAIPLWATALLVPVVAAASGAATARTTLAPFFHPIIALFLGSFLLAEAMTRWGLSRRVATAIVLLAGRSPRSLFAALLASSALLSMWMSNTASTAVLVPIALAVTEPLGSRAFCKAAVLGIAYAATVGGVGSAVGTPANPLALEFLTTFAGREAGFTTWFAYGLPFVLLFLPVVGFLLWRTMGVDLDPARFAESRRAARASWRELGAPRREEWLVSAIFVAVIALWLTSRWHGVHVGIVALGAAVVLALCGLSDDRDLMRIAWPSLVTFGGGLALGLLLTNAGLSDWIATRLEAFATLPSWVASTAVAGLALALTAVASNTATAAMLVPLAIPLAAVLHLDPARLVVLVAIASSIDFALVIGTPPTMIAYSTGLFSTTEIFRRGVVLDAIGILVLVTAVAACWHLLGVA
ncbi:MAG: DASS family sodium-coupled anion symporter [Planctomycetota bacterium]|nr:MAG: DASS family sodium-coupled anion symporter [Planctomycetota bacterium]